jgi:hypothetical protein
VAWVDLHKLQPLLEVIWGLLQRGLTGIEILWTFFQLQGSIASSMRGNCANVSEAKLSHPPLPYRVGWHRDQHLGMRDSCSRGCGKAGGGECRGHEGRADGWRATWSSRAHGLLIRRGHLLVPPHRLTRTSCIHSKLA